MQSKLNTLAKIARQLNDANIVWALGASMMLYLRGIVEEAHDIDIMVAESDAEAARREMDGLGQLQPKTASGQYLTHTFLEYVVDGVDVDVISGFVIVKDGTAHEMPFDGSHIDQRETLLGVEIPLQSLADWQQYYELMGRSAKARMIAESR